MTKELPTLPSRGILDEVLESIVPRPRPPAASKLAVVACGVKIHFPWEAACRRAREAGEAVRKATEGLPVDVVAAQEPFEDPDELLAFLDAQGNLAGIVFFHAAYTAGEIGSHLGRWLLDHPTPLLSWAWPEPGNGGRNEANSLTCQNFLLNMWARMRVPYAWMHRPIGPEAGPDIECFARACHARAAFRHAKLLHAGGSRVTAFYDGETDELGVMGRLGCRFDRVDLETVHQHARCRFSDADLERLRQALEEHPLCAGVDLPAGQILQTYRFGLGMLDMAAERGYAGATVKSWPDLFDCYGCAIDGAVSMMNDYGFCVAEEGEMNGLLSSLALHFLSAGRAVPTLMDLSIWRQPEDRLGIWHCGASPTRLLKLGSKFAATKHSILENGDPSTAVGLMLEFLLALGPVTLHRYLSPDASRWFAFEGHFIETEPAYRGAYGLLEPTPRASIAQILGTIFDAGLDHHWSLGYGHWLGELRMLNHFCGIQEIPLRQAGGFSGLSR